MLHLKDRPIRSDPAGDGHYHASRGNRLHNGIDLTCQRGELVPSPVTGLVTKHGYPYSDDLEWQYIQITDELGLNHRLFYVEPTKEVGESVEYGEECGQAQGISQRYPNQGMTDHIHYEVRDERKNYFDPSEFLV